MSTNSSIDSDLWDELNSEAVVGHAPPSEKERRVVDALRLATAVKMALVNEMKRQGLSYRKLAELADMDSGQLNRQLKVGTDIKAMVAGYLASALGGQLKMHFVRDDCDGTFTVSPKAGEASNAFQSLNVLGGGATREPMFGAVSNTSSVEGWRTSIPGNGS